MLYIYLESVPSTFWSYCLGYREPGTLFCWFSMGDFSPWGIPHGELLRKSMVLHEFLIFSHAVKKLINALSISKTCTIHFSVLGSAILRTRYTFCMGDFSPWGIPHGELLQKSMAFHEFLIFLHAVKKLINALYERKTCIIHNFVLSSRISRTRYTFWLFFKKNFTKSFFFVFSA